MARAVLRLLAVALCAGVLLVGACGEPGGDAAGSGTEGDEDAGAATAWVEVAACTGEGTGETDSFSLQGGRQRLEFTVDRGSSGSVRFVIVSVAGDERGELFDSDVVAASEGAELEGSSSTELPAGDYVIAAEAEGGVSWAVTVSEER